MSLPIVFEGLAAERLWDNVRSSLHLLEEMRALRNAGKYRASEWCVQYFMWICYAGETQAASREIAVHNADKGHRLASVDEVDATFYKVVRRQENVTLQLNLGRTQREYLDLGNAVGYSAVISLSDKGLENYLGNRCPGFKLVHDVANLRPAPSNRRQSEAIYISSAVHVPSLRRLFAKAEPDAQPLNDPVSCADDCYRRAFEASVRRRRNRNGGFEGLEVFEETLRQIRRLIVPMSFDDSGELVTLPSFRLPIILCPISGNGDGAFLVSKAGLWPSDRDLREHLRYTMDFSRYNASDASEHERLLIRRAVKYLR